MILAFCFIALIFSFMIADIIKRDLFFVLATPFWVFTFFFVLSYPVKLILIEIGFPYLAPTSFSSLDLNLALMVAVIFWFLTFFTYSIFRYFSSSKKPNPRALKLRVVDYPRFTKDYRLTLFCLILFFASSYYYVNLLQGVGYSLANAFVGNEQNEARFGSGPKFLLGSLYFIAIFLYLFLVKEKNSLTTFLFLAVALLLSVLNTVLLGTRRPLFLIIYLFLVYLALSRGMSRKNIAILSVFPYISAFAAPVGQLIRYDLLNFMSGNFSMLKIEYFFVSIGSTFEGIEHLAAYLRKVGFLDMIVGVDYGLAYLFNSGLAFFPRALWSSKPEMYGSVEIQDFLYSSGFSTMTLPPGIVVDSLYGFGFLGLVIYAILVACLLVWIERVILIRPRIGTLSLVISVYIYINLFNFVRGGTGLFQGVLLVLVFFFFSLILKRLRVIYNEKNIIDRS